MPIYTVEEKYVWRGVFVGEHELVINLSESSYLVQTLYSLC